MGCLSKLFDSAVDGVIICSWYRDWLQQIVWNMKDFPGSWVGLWGQIILWQVQYGRNPWWGKNPMLTWTHNSSISTFFFFFPLWSLSPFHQCCLINTHLRGMARNIWARDFRESTELAILVLLKNIWTAYLGFFTMLWPGKLMNIPVMNLPGLITC